MRIGIDLMGSDSSPHILFEAVLRAADCLKADCKLIVIGTQSVLEGISAFKPYSKTSSQIIFQEAADMIGMAEEPLKAVRSKKDASLVVGMRLLKKGQIDAFVSCGNTGALIAAAALSIPMLPGIKRPALLANLPTEKGLITTIDVGSTVAVRSSFLVDFARLGAAFQHAVMGIKEPSVGLLNVGVESKKGTMEIRAAYEYLMAEKKSGKTLPMKFVGNIEARDVFKGTIDVLVTDGFTGNVLLKAAEGMSDFIFGTLERKLLGGASEAFSQEFKKLQAQFDYAEYPGALVCGVEGLIIKVHGTGSPKALFNSICAAADYVQKDVISSIKSQLDPN